MRYDAKLAKITAVLAHELPPVMTPGEIAAKSGLSYRQVLSTLNKEHHDAMMQPPYKPRFISVGNSYGTWYYSRARFDGGDIPF